METPNTEMLRGRVDIFVLKAISDSDGYGYDILNYIHEKTEGHYEMKQSSVYSVLKRLEKQGYIYSFSGNESNGAKRRYYALTDSGKELLSEQEKEWAYTRTLLDNLVSDKSFDLKTDTPPFHPSDLRPMTRRAPKDDFVEYAQNEPETSGNTDIQADNQADSPIEKPTVAEDNVDSSTTIDLSVGYTEPVDEDFESDAEKQKEALATLYNLPAEENTEKDAADSPVVEEKSFVAPFVTPDPQPSNDAYRDFYNGLFENVTDNKSSYQEKKVDDYTDIDCSHINDLKMRLEDEGIKLRSFDPTIPGKSTIKYLMTNKIMRDVSLLGYLTLVVFLLIVGLVKSFEVSLTAILVVGGLGLLIPAVCVLISVNNPSKRVKDGLKLSKILLTSLVLYLAVFIISLIINLIVPNGHSLNTLPTYAPAIIALFIPLSAAIFAILYKSDKYHLSSR